MSCRPYERAGWSKDTAAMGSLGEIAAGKIDVQIFDRVGKNKLGAQRTGEFDLSNLSGTGQHTRGLPGTGFDRKLPFDKTTLEQLARQLLIEGLPEVWQPLPPVPPTAITSSRLITEGLECATRSSPRSPTAASPAPTTVTGRSASSPSTASSSPAERSGAAKT
jgi:hypothetical protein